MENLSLRFIRWAAGLTILGLITGYGPLGHYLLSGIDISCPWAPVHGHTALLSFVGMTLFGLTYRALPGWANGTEPRVKLVRAHFLCSVVGILGVTINGTVGYQLLKLVTPGFYYIGDEGKATLNLWLSIDGVFLTIYGIGCVLFLIVLLKSTSYKPVAAEAA